MVDRAKLEAEVNKDWDWLSRQVRAYPKRTVFVARGADHPDSDILLMNRVSAIFSAVIAAAPVRMWALIGAGPIATAVQVGLIWIIWRGGWPAALASEQLHYIGIIAFGNTAIIAVIVVALAAARVRAQGIGGTSIDIDGGGDDAPKASKVTVTTTAETKS